MGIKISKPVIYLGNKSIKLNKIIKKKYDYKDKIGSSRIHVEEHKSVFEMALEVGKKALKNIRQKPKFLIFVSQTQEKNLPSSAEKIAQNIKLEDNSLILTLSSGCSGFVQALYLANKLLSKSMRSGLIICTEKYSSIIGNKNIKTKLLFSDASSATVVNYNNENNILDNYFGFDGNNSEALEINKIDNKEILNMDGNKLLIFALKNIPEIIKKISKKHKIINKYFIHPGSKILLDSIILRSQINENKVLDTFKTTGNTVSTSIPLIINKNYNIIKKNEKIFMSGFGVGLSHASILIKWI